MQTQFVEVFLGVHFAIEYKCGVRVVWEHLIEFLGVIGSSEDREGPILQSSDH
jgi:hypothetical protein